MQGWKLNPEMRVFAEKLKFLRYAVLAESLCSWTEKIWAVEEQPTQKNDEIWSFLGSPPIIAGS